MRALRKILVDSSVLISATKPRSANDNPAVKERRERFRQLLNAPDTRIFLTPLILYETLRGASTEERSSLLETLEEFPVLDFTKKHAILAARLWWEFNWTSDRRANDPLHVAVAVLEGLEIESADKDWGRLYERGKQLKQDDAA